ncbi:MAG: hypothetical protein IT328_18895 [Caldilineaceae bacterium]|nr:hypothetical protein [Caldilineaceae bacterium]
MMPQLVGETVARAALSPATVDEMVQLFSEHYDLVCPEHFRRDLAQKDQVVLLREERQGTLQGFSTLAVYTTTAQGRKVGVVYSGDTIIRPAFWGTPALPSVWIKRVLALAAQLPQPVYWLLISSGYKSYRFLPVFYREFYPRYDCPTPPEQQAILDELAQQRFGAQYDAASGVVRFVSGATPLRPGVADVSEERQRNPHIRFFLARNPGHAQGDELVCLTRIAWENLTSAGQRMAS